MDNERRIILLTEAEHEALVIALNALGRPAQVRLYKSDAARVKSFRGARHKVELAHKIPLAPPPRRAHPRDARENEGAPYRKDFHGGGGE